MSVQLQNMFGDCGYIYVYSTTKYDNTFVLGYKYIIIIGIHQAPVALFVYPTVNLTYNYTNAIPSYHVHSLNMVN